MCKRMVLTTVSIAVLALSIPANAGSFGGGGGFHGGGHAHGGGFKGGGHIGGGGHGSGGFNHGGFGHGFKGGGFGHGFGGKGFGRVGFGHGGKGGGFGHGFGGKGFGHGNKWASHGFGHGGKGGWGKGGNGMKQMPHGGTKNIAKAYSSANAVASVDNTVNVAVQAGGGNRGDWGGLAGLALLPLAYLFNNNGADYSYYSYPYVGTGCGQSVAYSPRYRCRSSYDYIDK